MAGSARGRRLAAPAGTDTRPTADRVREATFNSLDSLQQLVDVSVLDLFAGSGALGIEALSRGAARVTFVDHAAVAVRTIAANLQAVGFSDRATVVAGDAWHHLDGGGAVYGLVLLDPPYAFDGWERLLPAVAGRLGSHGVVVTESDRPVLSGAAGWMVQKSKTYGDTVVEIGRPGVDLPQSSGAPA